MEASRPLPWLVEEEAQAAPTTGTLFPIAASGFPRAGLPQAPGVESVDDREISFAPAWVSLGSTWPARRSARFPCGRAPAAVAVLVRFPYR